MDRKQQMADEKAMAADTQPACTSQPSPVSSSGPLGHVQSYGHWMYDLHASELGSNESCVKPGGAFALH
eukprot:6110990-Pyramimonas_sp.AAC.1